MKGKIIIRVGDAECRLSVAASAGPSSEDFAEERTLAVGGDTLDAAIIKHVP